MNVIFLLQNEDKFEYEQTMKLWAWGEMDMVRTLNMLNEGWHCIKIEKYEHDDKHEKDEHDEHEEYDKNENDEVKQLAKKPKGAAKDTTAVKKIKNTGI